MPRTVEPIKVNGRSGTYTATLGIDGSSIIGEVIVSGFSSKKTAKEIGEAFADILRIDYKAVVTVTVG